MPVHYWRVTSVGERALAACRYRGTYDVYHAQWGARPDILTAAFESTASTTLVDGCDWQWQQRCSGPAFVETLDYLTYEAVYIISDVGISVGLPLWFGLPAVGECDHGLGVLVRVESRDEFRKLRKSFRRLKAHLCDGVVAGALTTETVWRCLCGFLADREYHCPRALRVRAGLWPGDNR